MVFLEKHGSPDFVKKLIDRIHNADSVSYYRGIEPDALFDGLNLNHGERFYSEKKGEDFYFVTDHQNVYVLTLEQMKEVHAAIVEASKAPQ